MEAGCEEMRRKTFQAGILWRLMIALILALCLVLINSKPAAALSLGEHFSLSYSVEFSKTQIVGSELFYVTVEATANCTSNLPLPYSLASELKITGRVIAEHQASLAKIELNQGFTISLDSFI